MREQERREFLAEPHVGVLSVAGEDGRPPLTVPLWYGYEPGGNLSFFTGTRELIDGALAGGVHPLFLVEEEYRLALLDAESAFVERFIERITHPETGWGRPWAEFRGESATIDERSQP